MRFALQTLFLASMLCVLAGVAGYLYVARDLPSVAQLRDVHLQIPLRVYSADGLLIGEFGEQKRVPVAFENLPATLIDAVLAAEDDRFFEHHGVDYAGLLRAALELARTGEKRQGGSTITMQVARNFFLSREKTYLRKAREIVLALRIERALSKQEIFELYANRVFLGHRAYGFAAAAQVYFDASLEALTLPETALLAGLPKAPSRLNPVTAPERARARRDYVLARMRELHSITPQQYASALQTPVEARLHQLPIEVEAPYVAEMARVWALERFGESAYMRGLEVFTTVSSRWQEGAQRALRDGLRAYERRHGYRGPQRSHGLPLDEARLRAELAARQRGDDLIPAVIASVDGPRARLITAGPEITLDSEAFSWALPSDEKGSGADLSTRFAAGQEVLLERTASGWRLAQAPEVEGALVALDPDSGAIRALVGGYSFAHSSYNRVTQADRQPGSNFKPFLYAAALAAGYSPASVVNDAPVVFAGDTLAGDWRPENFSGRFFGPTRLRVALAQSRNLVSVRLAHQMGVRYVRDYVSRFGFPKRKLPHNLSLALGSGALTPLELVRGYAVLANGGFRVRPHLIDHVLDQDGAVVWSALPALACRACDAPPGTAEDGASDPAPPPAPARAGPFAERVQPEGENFILTTMLRDVIRSGTGRGALALGRDDLAGKTGTTNEQRDAWFSGFNGDVAATVWVGFDQPRSLGGRETGARAALPIWVDFMRIALAGRPEQELRQPESVLVARIDPDTGQRAAAGQPDALFEYFLAGRPPADSAGVAAQRDSPRHEAQLVTDLF